MQSSGQFKSDSSGMHMESPHSRVGASVAGKYVNLYDGNGVGSSDGEDVVGFGVTGWGVGFFDGDRVVGLNDPGLSVGFLDGDGVACWGVGLFVGDGVTGLGVGLFDGRGVGSGGPLKFNRTSAYQGFVFLLILRTVTINIFPDPFQSANPYDCPSESIAIMRDLLNPSPLFPALVIVTISFAILLSTFTPYTRLNPTK